MFSRHAFIAGVTGFAIGLAVLLPEEASLNIIGTIGMTSGMIRTLSGIRGCQSDVLILV